ncbi:MAG: recombinase family protein, partial [Armatimonadetes bacterium]|nr:recombinase family protein [Armatimonadota bacterium]NIO98658.1 recombinase family protein [Armatimonadota bacterium]
MPQYAALMRLARQGEIDLVICRSRDRLGRTDSLIATLEQYLSDCNVQILSLDMPTRIV